MAYDQTNVIHTHRLDHNNHHNHNHHNHHHLPCCLPQRVFFPNCDIFVNDGFSGHMPDVDHAGTGAARRRRERRHRVYLRHARMSVAMPLAEATHHSAPMRLKTARDVEEVEAHEQYNAPRRQEQPPPGERPAPLSEIAGPQAAVTVGYVAAEAPSLVVAPVAEHDGLDDAAVQYLLQQSSPGSRGGGDGGEGAGGAGPAGQSSRGRGTTRSISHERNGPRSPVWKGRRRKKKEERGGGRTWLTTGQRWWHVSLCSFRS